jgi:Mce-associated membrane protein
VSAEEARPIEDAGEAAETGWTRRRSVRGRGRLSVAVWAIVVIASVSLFAVLLDTQYRPDRAMDDANKQSALDAANNGAVSVLTYGSDSFDRDVSSARSYLTGDFLSQYDQYIQTAVAPIAKTKGIKTTATVVRKAVSELHPDSADVLLYINQTTQTSDNPAPTLAASSVMVKLSKVDGKWLISSFKPV